jgi:AraC-like DNA-binding protein
MDEKLYPPYKISFVVDVLHEEGILPTEALRGSGLTASELLLPSTRISYRQLVTVYENALRLSKDPAIALRSVHRIHITNFGLYGYALLSSPTIRDAYAFAVRYHKLATPTTRMGLREENGVLVWTFESLFEFDPASDIYRFILELQFAAALSLVRDVVGVRIKPLGAYARYPAPHYANVYPIYLECPAHFGQPTNALRFDARLLDVRPGFANSLTAALLQELCDQMLGELQSPSGVATKVQRLLLQNPGEFPDIDQVAEKLHMVSRTLRRKLSAEGTSYTQILSDVRKHLAIGYLRETRRSVDDIAESLGFSEASSFRQAFRRWTGKNPSDFRPG